MEQKNSGKHLLLFSLQLGAYSDNELCVSMITRLILKISCFLAFVLVPLVLMLHQPIPASADAVTTLFSSSADCPAPCVMGIALEESTAEDALAILEAHEWVGDITVQRSPSDVINAISWTWSGNQPTFIEASRDAVLTLNWSGLRITSITIDVNLSMGELWQMVGDPLKTTFYADSSGMMTYLGAYSDAKLHTYGIGNCPATANTFWHMQIHRFVWLSPYKDADLYFNVANPYSANSCKQFIYSNGLSGD